MHNVISIHSNAIYNIDCQFTSHTPHAQLNQIISTHCILKIVSKAISGILNKIRQIYVH